MKTLTKMAAWVGAAALVAVPSAHAAPVHATQNLNPAATAEVSSEESSDAVTPFIVGGERASMSNWPWMAKVLIYTADKTPDKPSHCSGFIVSQDIVVTAAHCVDDSPHIVTRINLRYGDINWKEGTSVDVPIENVEHGGGIRNGYWAVLKVNDPLQVSSYLPLASHDAFDEGSIFRTAGWGRLGPGGRLPDNLRKIDELSFVTDEKCSTDDADICAGYWETGGKDTCQGDSGGPLIKYVGDTYPVAVGITSHGPECGKAPGQGKYAEVSTYWNEIVDAVDRLGGEQPQPAPWG